MTMTTPTPTTKQQLLELSIAAAKSHDRRGCVDFLLAEYARSIRDGDASSVRQDPQALASLLKATASDASDDSDPVPVPKKDASPPLTVHGGGVGAGDGAGDGAGVRALRERIKAVK